MTEPFERFWRDDPEYKCYDLLAHQRMLSQWNDGLRVLDTRRPLYAEVGASVIKLTQANQPARGYMSDLYEIRNISDPTTPIIRLAGGESLTIGRETTPDLNLDSDVSRRHLTVAPTPDSYMSQYVCFIDEHSTNGTRLYLSADPGRNIEAQRKVFDASYFQQPFQRP